MKRKSSAPQAALPLAPPLGALVASFMAAHATAWGPTFTRSRRCRLAGAVEALGSDASPERLQRWLVGRVKRGELGPESAAHVLSDLRAVAKWVRAAGVVRGYEGPADPLQAARMFGGLRAPNDRELWAEPDRTRARLLAACPNAHARLLVRLLVERAIRIGEALALRWRDLDAARGTVLIAAHRSASSSRRGPRKWNEPPVLLGLSQAAAADMAAARRERMAAPERWAFPLAGVYALPYDARRLSALRRQLWEAVPEAWQDRRRASGRVAGASAWHHLRHEAAADYQRSGCELATLQRMLGHKHEATTFVYLRSLTGPRVDQSIPEACNTIDAFRASRSAAPAEGLCALSAARSPDNTADTSGVENERENAGPRRILRRSIL